MFLRTLLTFALVTSAVLASSACGEEEDPPAPGNLAGSTAAGAGGAVAGSGGAGAGQGGSVAGSGGGDAGSGGSVAGSGGGDAGQGGGETGGGGSGAGQGGGDTGGGGGDAGQGGATAGGGGAGGDAGDSGGGGSDAGGGGSDAGNGGEAGGGGASPEVVPVTKEELFAYLQSGAYKSFAQESKVHKSTGPHGGDVRTYLNAALFASFQAGNSSHPQGSAVVKELYGSSNQVTGWAVAVKTDDDSKGGAGWYWYEVFSTTSGSSPVIAANGPNFCSSCHGNGGVDYVLTPFPLQ